MAFALVVLIIIVLLIIGLFILIWTNNLPTISTPNNAFASQVNRANSLQAGFPPGSSVTCPLLPNGNVDPFCRGNCLFYETFSQEASIVNNLEPITNPGTNQPAQFSCTDGFIQALSLQTSTCGQDICVGQDGQTYLNGQSEQYYVPCGGLGPCTKSFRNAIVLNFQLGPNGQPNLPIAQCIAANSISETANVQFIPTVCPNSVSLSSNTFLNVIPGTIPNIPKNLNITGYQIQAPGTNICLQVNEDVLVTNSCLAYPSQGFSWYLFPGLIINNLSGGQAWNYPQQFINVDAIFLNAIPTLENLSTTFSTQVQAYTTLIKALSTTDQAIVNAFLNNLNLAINSGNCSNITNQITNLNTNISAGLCTISPPCPNPIIDPPFSPMYRKLTTSVINTLKAASALASLIQQLFGILGTSTGGCPGLGINSLQSGNNNTQLVLASLGNCPANSRGQEVVCPFSTQLISGQSWNCVSG